MTSRCYVATESDEGMRLDACMGQHGLGAARRRLTPSTMAKCS